MSDDAKLGSSEPLGPRYDGTTMDNQQLHGTTRRNQPVATAGETASPNSESGTGLREALALKFETCDHARFLFDAGRDEPMREESLEPEAYEIICAALHAPQPANVPREEGGADREALAKRIERGLEATDESDGFFSPPLYPKEWRLILAALRTRPPHGWQDVGTGALTRIVELAMNEWYDKEAYTTTSCAQHIALAILASPLSQGAVTISGPNREAP